MVGKFGHLQGTEVIGLAVNLLWLVVMKAHLIHDERGYLAPVCVDCLFHW